MCSIHTVPNLKEPHHTAHDSNIYHRCSKCGNTRTYPIRKNNDNLSAKLVTLLISLVLISSVPTWTYELSREQMIAMYLLIYLMLL